MVSDLIEAQILGPSLVREIYYRILTGAQGGSMRATLNSQSHFGKVTRVIRKIHCCYQEHLDVVSLAQEANMSVPSFSSTLSQSDGLVADTVSEVDAPAPGTIAYATQRGDRFDGSVQCRLCERFSIQPRIQTFLWVNSPRRDRMDEGDLCTACAAHAIYLRLVALAMVLRRCATFDIAVRKVCRP